MPKYIVANWKQNKNLKEISDWLEVYKNQDFVLSSDINVIVCPSFPYLNFLKENSDAELLSIATQDVSEYSVGSHTGNVGAEQVKDFCTYSIIGHSERKEDRTLVNKKRDLCLENSITPIICFVSLTDAINSAVPGVILAMEDPTNISKNGVYNVQNPTAIEESLNEVKSKLSIEVPLLYGGSVNKDNVTSLSAIDTLNGILVGHASLDALHFIKLVQAFNN
ncbi:MAG: triose-phosphate isomerase [Patescibacteria group bacterium]